MSKLVDFIWDAKARTHSYGFAQIYLSDDARLHLFDADVCQQACIPDQVSVRHNHRYDFRSRILRGIIIDQPCHFVVPCDDFEFREANSSGSLIPAWREWEVQPAHEGQLGIRPTDRHGYIIEGPPRVLKEGESYDMQAGVFHSTAHIGTTLSLFKRDAVQPTWSKLIVPPGMSPVHSLSKQPDQTFLKAKYLTALGGLGLHAIKMIEMEIK